MKIYLGADHAGFDLKEKIKRFLDKRKIQYVDLSPSKVIGDDYPDHAFAVAKKVAKSPGSRGILICGTGTGMVIAANKIKGARAAVGYDNYSAIMGKKDNDVNILCLRGRKFSFRKNLKILDKWLKSKFSNGERHKERIRKIASYERKK